MKYMGSKSRIAKHITPILTRNLTQDRWYVEPFAGGMNMMCNIHHEKRIAGDLNNYLIAMWKYLVYHDFGDKFPRIISKETYSYWREIFNLNRFNGLGCTYAEAIIGWIGFMGSFNGRFFDGGYSGHDVNGRDYIGEQIQNTLSQVDKLKGVELWAVSYQDIVYPSRSVVYCDPPYKDTKQYSVSKNFNHDEFWAWCRNMTFNGHDVIISEYDAPSDFVCIWEKLITNTMNTHNTYKPTEKLFVHKIIANNYYHID
jgi:DNA adenine methylase|nr:MAG TPA: DNA adenine methylase [Caudoviricetes sp.]